MALDRIELFRIFVRVVDCAGFSRAADQLDLPRSTVSEAVRSLEQRLGARLLHRTTRRVTPTQDGLALYERCQLQIADMDETEQLFRQAPQALAGRLKVDLPSRIGRLIVAPALPDFLRQYPQIDVELGMGDRAVNLVEDAVDCVLRVGPLEDSQLVARPVGPLPLLNVASADYLRRHGTPSNTTDLDAHWAVLYASPTSGRVEPWEWRENGELLARRMRGRITVNSAEASIACCLAGLGLIQIPAYDVRDELAAGRLVEVLPDHRADPLPMTLLYPHRRHLSQRLQVFLDWLHAVLQREVLAPGPPSPANT
ncbi:LysR family transcriptional regulator [Pseudoxanthomonas sp.]|uniref:LysR family transcriptional regulator n=1 Tax=Pseudoxanthomonas sp. TaxID=1871049 RepID=UPI0026232303|nr:LysR family transcriptional regulator [Pseudoxanthomonas sp.]WDS37451.1 MAG: LysR family transcriptional regulator [Pseudoxanthomonas sp.]